MHNTETGTDRNISLVAGWNLIGYDGDINLSLSNAVFNNGSNTYTWAQAVANNKVHNYLSYYDSSAVNASQRRFKYLGPSRVDDNAFRKGKGYWVYANESGNLTLPGVGGTRSGERFNVSKLRFSNGSMELSFADAKNNTYLWIQNPQFYGDPDEEGQSTFYYICGSGCTKSTISSLEGIFVKSNIDNLTIIRQN